MDDQHLPQTSGRFVMRRRARTFIAPLAGLSRKDRAVARARSEQAMMWISMKQIRDVSDNRAAEVRRLDQINEALKRIETGLRGRLANQNSTAEPLIRALEALGQVYSENRGAGQTSMLLALLPRDPEAVLVMATARQISTVPPVLQNQVVGLGELPGILRGRRHKIVVDGHVMLLLADMAAQLARTIKIR